MMGRYIGYDSAKEFFADLRRDYKEIELFPTGNSVN